jgi:hypothetical protein
MPILGSSAGATKGPASAPTIGTATAGNASASVTFSAPSFSKLPITNYTVTASPGGATGTGASSPITVSGLSNGTAYTFTVTATNAAGTSAASSASNSVTPAYQVGDVGPGGGKIFYDAGSTLSWGRYLEAPGNTWSGGGSDPIYAWSGNTNTLIGASAQGTAIGTGAANTTAAIAQNSTAGRAITAARAYNAGGVAWSLPSKDELNQMYLNRGLIGGFNTTTDNYYYYTSSEFNATNVWVQRFYTQPGGGGGEQYFYQKGNSGVTFVRPCRAFS